MRRVVVLFGVAASLAVVACGGGDDAPSREEFARNADSICKDLENATNRIREAEPKNLEEAAKVIGDLKREADDATKRLDDLEVPEGADGEKAEQFVGAVKASAGQVTTALDEMQKAAEANDQKALVAAAGKLENVETNEVNKLAKDVGANGCAN